MNWKGSVEAFLSTSDLSKTTAAQYRRSLRDFHAWYRQTYGEEPDPVLLTDEELRDWRAHLSDDRKLAASTVNARLAAVKSLALFCGNRLVARGVRKVERPVEPLTGRDLGRLARAIESRREGDRWQDLRDVAVVALMARAGLRVSEVCNLDVGDVETNERSGWALVRQGKGLKERRVPLSALARKAIRAYLDARPDYVPDERDKEDLERDPLFLSRSRRRLGPRDVQRMVKVAARQAGITTVVTPHTLRHTFATRYLERGGTLPELRDILGHTSIATTNQYTHSNAARMQERVEEL